MSQELKAIKANIRSKSPAIAVTQFCGPNSQSKLQLTQGIGNALKGEAGFIQLNKAQALELINSLAHFVAGE